MPGPEISIDTETSLAEQEEIINLLTDFHANAIEEGNLDEQLIEENEAATQQIWHELRAGEGVNALRQPRAAEEANRTITDILSDQSQAVEKSVRFLVSDETVQKEILKDQASAKNVLIPNQEVTPTVKERIIAGIAMVSVIISLLSIPLIAKLFKASTQNHSSIPAEAGSKSGDADELDQLLHAQQNYMSLLMQAAADQPVNFENFGISRETYQALRTTVIALRDNLSEDDHWELQAQQAELLYPSTQKYLTLGDHLVALDFQFALLEPLYNQQPFELDVSQTISSLANLINMKADNPMPVLYRSIMDLAPESTGISRAQRILLLRFAITRAVARSLQS